MADGQQKGRLLLIQISNNEVSPTPETFSALCGFKTRSFNLSANEVDTTIPDCENPGNAVQKTSEPGIVSRTFTGSGAFVNSVLSRRFIGYVNDAELFRAKVIVPGVGSYTGQWMVSSFELSGEMEGNMEFNGTWTAAGPLTFVAEDAS